MSKSLSAIVSCVILAAFHINAEANNVHVALDHSCNSIIQEVSARESSSYWIEGFVRSQYIDASKLTFSIFTLDGVFAANGTGYLDNGNFRDVVSKDILGEGANGIRLTRCDLGLGSGAEPPTDYQWNRVQDLVNLAEVICAFGLPELATVCREF